jgi:type VI secretion system secreted protein Hcp
VELCRAAGDKTKYMEYKFSDVIISSVRPGGSSQGGESLPLEEISLNYAKCEVIYTETDHKTGSPKGDVKSHWDKTSNRGG